MSSSSSSSSLILSLLLLYAVAAFISCATIGKNTNDAAADDDEAMEKQFNNLLRLAIDCAKMLKDGRDPVHVQKIVLLEMEATKNTQTRLNEYLYKRMDANKDGLLSKEELVDFNFNELLPKMVALANIPKALANIPKAVVAKMEKKMLQAKPAMQMFIGQLFVEADTNGDGKLSMAESTAYKLNVPKLQQDIRKMVAKAKAEEAKKKPMEEF